MKAKFVMSMTSNTASRVPPGPPVTSRGVAGDAAWCAESNFAGWATARPVRVPPGPEKDACVPDLTRRATPA